MIAKQSILLRTTYSVINNTKLFILSIAVLLSGCVSTTEQVSNEKSPMNSELINEGLIDTTMTKLLDCEMRASEIELNAAKTLSAAQYQTAANALQQCIKLAPVYQTHLSSLSVKQKQVNQTVMQMYAASTLNYIKAADLVAAQTNVDGFKKQFPNQDLYFPDYTSFLDTTTAVLQSQQLSTESFESLNINPMLRAEIERKRYWQSH